ncbi:MAG: DEAD/DEAH box helicase [Muribaculaceae bacterium]|nr:DEAD/DEAH box helicase [Muribaculaceae bacterium]
MRFDELPLSDDILDALDAMHFEECTPIQEQSIGVILDGHDLIACAQTGTGKTAAYLLPLIDLLADTEADSKVKCVVMVPTHELAQQIDRSMEGFSYYIPVSSLAIHGGNDGKEFARQQHALRQGADMVIATPGRLLAHMKMGYVDLSCVQYFVLDEADRMLDMGFSEDIMRIVAELPRERQTLMFSATMPKKIQQLAATILNEPREVKIAVSRPNERIDQSVIICYEYQKQPLLKRLFEMGYNKRVIVFSSSKQKVKELTAQMRRDGFKAAEMHSDLDQKAREEVMLGFRAGRIDILIATDILARGIDVDDIEMVVNYDVPHEAEDYVHRIGRTARAGAGGRAVTFVGTPDQYRWSLIERFLDREVRRDDLGIDVGPLPEYNPSANRGNGRPGARGNGGGRGKGGNGRNGGHGSKQGDGKGSGKGRADKPRKSSGKPASDKPASEKPRKSSEKPRKSSEKSGSGKPEKRYRHRSKKAES